MIVIEQGQDLGWSSNCQILRGKWLFGEKGENHSCRRTLKNFLGKKETAGTEKMVMYTFHLLLVKNNLAHKLTEKT